MRFLGLGLADLVSDTNTIWLFREADAMASDHGSTRIGPAVPALG
jgi:hypothetical protein